MDLVYIIIMICLTILENIFVCNQVKNLMSRTMLLCQSAGLVLCAKHNILQNMSSLVLSML